MNKYKKKLIIYIFSYWLTYPTFLLIITVKFALYPVADKINQFKNTTLSGSDAACNLKVTSK